MLSELKYRSGKRKEAHREARVYFLRFAGSIKVGTSINYCRRIAEMNTAFPEDVELLGTIPGSHKIEKCIHRRLFGFQRRGEWYRDCEQTRLIIDKILKANELALTEEERQDLARESKPKHLGRLTPNAEDTLAHHLSGLSREVLSDIAFRTDVPIRVVGSISIGNPVSAQYFLKVAAAAGFDPMNLQFNRPRIIGDFDMMRLATSLKEFRKANHLSQRNVAKQAGTSFATVCRAESGHYYISTRSFLSICRHFNADPFSFFVSRETAETSPLIITETKSARVSA